MSLIKELSLLTFTIWANFSKESTSPQNDMHLIKHHSIQYEIPENQREKMRKIKGWDGVKL
jgi:hypothetical protein